MPLTKKAPRSLVVNEWSDPDPDFDPATSADEQPLAPTAEGDPDLCPVCGDLLAWHEQACAVPAQAQAHASGLLSTPELLDRPTPALAVGFAYALGHPAQPTPTRTAQVIWRGQLKERHPTTGLVHRTNVYRLDDGY